MDLPPRKGMPSRQDVEMVASPYGTKLMHGFLSRASLHALTPAVLVSSDTALLVVVAASVAKCCYQC